MLFPQVRITHRCKRLLNPNKLNQTHPTVTTYPDIKRTNKSLISARGNKKMIRKMFILCISEKGEYFFQNGYKNKKKPSQIIHLQRF